MGMKRSTPIGQVGFTGHEIENDVIIQPLEGGQVGQRDLGYVAGTANPKADSESLQQGL